MKMIAKVVGRYPETAWHLSEGNEDRMWGFWGVFDFRQLFEYSREMFGCGVILGLILKEMSRWNKLHRQNYSSILLKWKHPGSRPVLPSPPPFRLSGLYIPLTCIPPAAFKMANYLWYFVLGQKVICIRAGCVREVLTRVIINSLIIIVVSGSNGLISSGNLAHSGRLVIYQIYLLVLKFFTQFAE